MYWLYKVDAGNAIRLNQTIQISQQAVISGLSKTCCTTNL